MKEWFYRNVPFQTRCFYYIVIIIMQQQPSEATYDGMHVQRTLFRWRIVTIQWYGWVLGRGQGVNSLVGFCCVRKTRSYESQLYYDILASNIFFRYNAVCSYPSKGDIFFWARLFIF
jgi:hypothetical protein